MFSSHIFNEFKNNRIKPLHIIKSEVINNLINPSGVDTSDINNKTVKSRLVRKLIQRIFEFEEYFPYLLIHLHIFFSFIVFNN